MKAILAGIIGTMFLMGAFAPLMSASDVQYSAVLDPQLKEKMDGADLNLKLEIIVTYNGDAKQNGMARFDALGLPHVDLKILPMTGAIAPVYLINEILGWREVRSVYWNAPIQFSLKDSVKSAGVPPVWNTYGERGKNATVLVIDSGVDGTHPDLLYSEKIIESAMPIDILGAGLPVAWAEGLPVTDSVGHGTHCLGTIGGTGQALGGYTLGAVPDPLQGSKYVGMAPECKLVSFGLGAALFVFGTVQGFEYALENQEKYGIRVISNSWEPSSFQEFSPDSPTSVATLECYKMGMLVVFAAGNSGPTGHTMNAYSVAPWVIGVAAGTKDKKLADFSSRGSNDTEMPYDHPDITAPGVEIMAAKAKAGILQALSPTSGPTDADSVLAQATFYIWMSGTSMACPHIAGIAALLFSANPRLSPDQAMDILVGTTDKMGENPVWKVGTGYVNATRAYLLARNTTGNLDAFKANQTKYSGAGDELFANDCTSVGYDYYPEVKSNETVKNVTVEEKKTPGFEAASLIMGLGAIAAVAVIIRKKKQ
ncbi:MAG: S8 family serine peptidase [Candidatus Thermoplasmatota archaeon]|nr:S8 family serine peptidase [Candidatus Thermoplasmatota archaeon]